MKLIKLTIFCICFSACWPCIADVNDDLRQKAKEVKILLGNFDGTWSGRVSSLNNYSSGGIVSDVKFETDVLFYIKNGEIEVVFRADKEKDPNWKKYNYNFTINQYETNAIIFTQNSGIGWVETYSFVITLEDLSTMGVTWNRVVNNIFKLSGDPDARAYFSGTTTFRKHKP